MEEKGEERRKTESDVGLGCGKVEQAMIKYLQALPYAACRPHPFGVTVADPCMELRFRPFDPRGQDSNRQV